VVTKAGLTELKEMTSVLLTIWSV